eukprot:scaffold59501_cov21-Prasinocladus_malaysianus.AAC.1
MQRQCTIARAAKQIVIMHVKNACHPGCDESFILLVRNYAEKYFGSWKPPLQAATNTSLCNGLLSTSPGPPPAGTREIEAKSPAGPLVMDGYYYQTAPYCSKDGLKQIGFVHLDTSGTEAVCTNGTLQMTYFRFGMSSWTFFTAQASVNGNPNDCRAHRSSRLYRNLVERGQALSCTCLSTYPGDKYPGMSLTYAVPGPGVKVSECAEKLRKEASPCATNDFHL